MSYLIFQLVFQTVNYIEIDNWRHGLTKKKAFNTWIFDILGVWRDVKYKQNFSLKIAF